MAPLAQAFMLMGLIFAVLNAPWGALVLGVVGVAIEVFLFATDDGLR